jgi:hypothetical protein
VHALGHALFRTGLAVYLVEAVCDVALALVFYVLLRPVNRELALLAAFFGLVSTAVFAVADFFYFTALIFLRNPSYLAGFSPEQLNSLSMYSLKMYAYGGIFMVFYGIASVIRGYLIARSRYLPRTLGILLVIAGVGFILKNAALVLAPAYASDVLLLPMFLAGVSLTAWFLIKGVDSAKWTYSGRRQKRCESFDADRHANHEGMRCLIRSHFKAQHTASRRSELEVIRLTDGHSRSSGARRPLGRWKIAAVLCNWCPKHE